MPTLTPGIVAAITTNIRGCDVKGVGLRTQYVVGAGRVQWHFGSGTRTVDLNVNAHYMIGAGAVHTENSQISYRLLTTEGDCGLVNSGRAAVLNRDGKR